MRSFATGLLFALGLACTAQTLPAIPDSALIGDGYWMQERYEPRYGGLVLPIVATTILATIFTMSDNRSANDLVPGVMGFGLGMGALGFTLEIKATRRKRFVPRY